MTKIRVELWAVANEPLPADAVFGAIVLAETGIVWSNQTCAESCSHPEAEGIYVPLAPGWLTDTLEGNWGGHGGDYPPQFVAEWLQRCEVPGYGKPETMADIFQPLDAWDGTWGEAWMPVRIVDDAEMLEQAAPHLAPFAGKVAVLTWGNSD